MPLCIAAFLCAIASFLAMTQFFVAFKSEIENPKLLPSSPFLLFCNQAQFAAHLAGYGGVFLCAAEKVWQHGFNGPVGYVFGYIVMRVGQVKAQVIAHA